MNWALRGCQSLPPIPVLIPVLHGALPAVLLVGEQDVVEVVDSRRRDERRGGEIARGCPESVAP
jgi:hypothetical protein